MKSKNNSDIAKHFCRYLSLVFVMSFHFNYQHRDNIIIDVVDNAIMCRDMT